MPDSPNQQPAKVASEAKAAPKPLKIKFKRLAISFLTFTAFLFVVDKVIEVAGDAKHLGDVNDQFVKSVKQIDPFSLKHSMSRYYSYPPPWEPPPPQPFEFLLAPPAVDGQPLSFQSPQPGNSLAMPSPRRGLGRGLGAPLTGPVEPPNIPRPMNPRPPSVSATMEIPARMYYSIYYTVKDVIAGGWVTITLALISLLPGVFLIGQKDSNPIAVLLMAPLFGGIFIKILIWLIQIASVLFGGVIAAVGILTTLSGIWGVGFLVTAVFKFAEHKVTDKVVGITAGKH